MEKLSVWSYHAICCKNTSEPLVDSETPSPKPMAFRTPSASYFSLCFLSGHWQFVWFNCFQMQLWIDLCILFGNVGCEICGTIRLLFLFSFGCGCIVGCISVRLHEKFLEDLSVISCWTKCETMDIYYSMWRLKDQCLLFLPFWIWGAIVIGKVEIASTYFMLVSF